MPAEPAEDPLAFLDAPAPPRPPLGQGEVLGDRVRTYVAGLDEALAGGIPRGNVVVLRGGPGTMKTTFALWVLHQNALREGRRGAYFSLEQSVDNFTRQAHSLGLRAADLQGRLVLVDVGLLRRHGLRDGVDWVEYIERTVQRSRAAGADLVVLDSLEGLQAAVAMENPRHDLFRLFTSIKEQGVTLLVITERPATPLGEPAGARVEDFLADGIVEFQFSTLSREEVQRRIRVLKMRGCRHDTSAMALVWDEGNLQALRVIAQA